MPFLNDAADALEFPPPPPEVLNGNGRDETLTGLEEHRPEGPFGLSDYEAVIGRERVDELKRLAEPLTGRGLGERQFHGRGRNGAHGGLASLRGTRV